MTMPGRIIILSGPSGAGKTTLHELLLKSPAFKGRIIRSISATTRSPRGKERHGRDYLFLTHKMFAHKIRTGQFLEWMKVFDNYYGTPMAQVRAAQAQGKHVLLCIDVKGALLVKKKAPDAIMIFIKTPTLRELKNRLSARSTDAQANIALRLKVAREELKKAGQYDHVLVNDKLDAALARLIGILRSELAPRR